MFNAAEYLSGSVKELLTRAGRFVPITYLRLSQAAVNYLAHGRWMHDRGFDLGERLQNRQQVWASVAQRVCEQRVLYLEFGVAHGGSMEYWSKMLRNPQSLLHGFDSFEGLPQAGGRGVKGEFGTAGRVAILEDERVRVVKGWFEDVLEEYSVPQHDVLVMNVAAELCAVSVDV